MADHDTCFRERKHILTQHFSGKEPGNCTHQWTTNDDTNTQALLTLSLLQVKEETQTTTEGRKKQRRGQRRRRQLS